MRRFLLSAFALACWIPAQQASLPVREGPGSISYVAPIPTLSGGINVPFVPKSVVEQIKHPPLPPLPKGPDILPQPDNPPTFIRTAGPLAIGDLAFTKNAQAGLGTTGIPGEPAVSSNGNTVLATWNTLASMSTDGGNTYSARTIGSVWPAIDGGTCCDQRVIYVPEHDMTIWLMQYSYSATTQKNTYGLAVFQGQTRLTNLNGWIYPIVPAQLGFAAGRWMDYPDIAFSRDHLFLCANVFDNIGSAFDAVVVRINLAPMATGGTVGIRAWQSNRDLSGVGASYRLTQGAHHESTKMWWASPTSTTQLSIWEVDDANTTPTRVDRAIASYVGGQGGVAPGPDGRDWMNFNDGRITGGYANHEQIGFLWTCKQNPPSRPLPYVRVSRFKVSDRTLVADNDIFGGSTATFAYPAVSTNAIGNVGVVLAYGSTTQHVTAAAGVVDGVYGTWTNGFGLALSANGTNGAPANRWGDYLSIEPWTANPLSFIGTQMRQSGGTSAANTESRVVMFQRDVYGPGKVAAIVIGRSPDGDMAVPITATVDSFAQGNGTTPMARSYNAPASYTLTTPATHLHTNNVRYCFKEWLLNGRFQGSALSRTTSASGHWVASYVRLRTLDVRNVHPTTNVSFNSSPADCNGVGTGLLPRVLSFQDGTGITVTVPDVQASAAFVRWDVQGGAAQTNRTLVLNMTRDYVVTAVYTPTTPGSWAPVGSGCRGSHGGTPFMAFSGGNPTVGGLHAHQVLSAPPSTLAWNVIGGSNTNFQGLPLPFDCAPLGAPGCRIYCSQDAVLSSGIDATGFGEFSLTYPRDRALAGQTYYTQFLIFNPPANQLGLIVSNYLRVTIGL